MINVKTNYTENKKESLLKPANLWSDELYGNFHLGFVLQDHPNKIQKAINLLLQLVKYNPDLCESDWQCKTAGMVIVMTMQGASG